MVKRQIVNKIKEIINKTDKEEENFYSIYSFRTVPLSKENR